MHRSPGRPGELRRTPHEPPFRQCQLRVWRTHTDQCQDAAPRRTGAREAGANGCCFACLNGSATEIRSLYLPGHSFTILAMDGRSAAQAGSCARIMAGNGGAHLRRSENDSSGLDCGDLADNDRHNGMGIVSMRCSGVRREGAVDPAASFKWNYAHLGAYLRGERWPCTAAGQTFEMFFEKKNAAADGFIGASGHVYATELDQAKLKALRDEVAKQKLANVTIVESAADDTKLPHRLLRRDFFAPRLSPHHRARSLRQKSPAHAEIRRAPRHHRLRPGQQPTAGRRRPRQSWRPRHPATNP